MMLFNLRCQLIVVNKFNPKKPPLWIRCRIRHYIKYYPKTGNLIWLMYRQKSRIGTTAGSINGRGYTIIRFKYKNKIYNCYGHHIAWYLYYGEWPPREVDHKNRIRSNNKIKNLRLATRNQAQRNRGIMKNNTTGIIGVTWHKRAKKYIVNIKLKNKRVHLGYFISFTKAINVRKQAEIKYFGRFNPILT